MQVWNVSQNVLVTNNSNDCICTAHVPPIQHFRWLAGLVSDADQQPMRAVVRSIAFMVCSGAWLEYLGVGLQAATKLFQVWWGDEVREEGICLCVGVRGLGCRCCANVWTYDQSNAPPRGAWRPACAMEWFCIRFTLLSPLISQPEWISATQRHCDIRDYHSCCWSGCQTLQSRWGWIALIRGGCVLNITFIVYPYFYFLVSKHMVPSPSAHTFMHLPPT